MAAEWRTGRRPWLPRGMTVSAAPADVRRCVVSSGAIAEPKIAHGPVRRVRRARRRRSSAIRPASRSRRPLSSTNAGRMATSSVSAGRWRSSGAPAACSARSTWRASALHAAIRGRPAGRRRRGRGRRPSGAGGRARPRIDDGRPRSRISTMSNGSASEPQREAARLQRAVLCTRSGRIDEALEIFAEAIPRLRQRDATVDLARVLANRGGIYVRRGELRQAVTDFDEAYDLFSAAGQEFVALQVRHNLGLGGGQPRPAPAGADDPRRELPGVPAARPRCVAAAGLAGRGAAVGRPLGGRAGVGGRGAAPARRRG